MEAGRLGEKDGDDAAPDDEALDRGEPRARPSCSVVWNTQLACRVTGKREEVAQAEDHEHGEPERRRDGHEAVEALVAQGDGRHIERAFDDPAEGEPA